MRFLFVLFLLYMFSCYLDMLLFDYWKHIREHILVELDDLVAEWEEFVDYVKFCIIENEMEE